MEERGLIIESRREVGAAVVTARGDVDLYSAARLGARVREELVARSASQVILDLRLVTFLDSTGIGMLVRCRREAAGRQVKLVLITTEKGPVATILRVAGLAQVFAVQADLPASALASSRARA